jgi:hypothetical protein
MVSIFKKNINPSGSHENRSGIWPMKMAFLRHSIRLPFAMKVFHQHGL